MTLSRVTWPTSSVDGVAVVVTVSCAGRTSAATVAVTLAEAGAARRWPLRAASLRAGT